MVVTQGSLELLLYSSSWFLSSALERSADSARTLRMSITQPRRGGITTQGLRQTLSFRQGASDDRDSPDWQS